MKVLVRISGTQRAENKETIFSVLEIIKKNILSQQSTKRIKSSGKSASTLDIQEVSKGGQLIGEDYFQQQITGRRPGKFPPIQSIQDWIDKKGLSYSKIKKKSLAFIIARKIAKKGTDIYSNKREGIDLDEAVNEALPILKDQLIKAGRIEIKSAIAQAIKGVKPQNLQI